MNFYWVFTALIATTVFSLVCADSPSVWSNILSCVHDLAHQRNNDTAEPEGQRQDLELSAFQLVSIICGEQDGFVRCLEESLRSSTDSISQIISSLFNPSTVAEAYSGLCSNISTIENGGAHVLNCLSEVKLTSCQNEMADYFFYMGVVKKFAPEKEQLSRETMETLLCSVSAQRRQCEVEALRQCSHELGDIMEQFYRKTLPDACLETQNLAEIEKDNHVSQ